MLPEPKEIITGTIRGGTETITPFKLTTGDYNKLKEVINTQKLNYDGFGEKTILETMNNYLESPAYTERAGIVEEYGLTNALGKKAAQEIYLDLAEINRAYIKNGENLYLESRGQNELQQRVDKKNKIKREYYNLLEKSFNNLNN